MDTKTESVDPRVLKRERTWTASDYAQERGKAAQTTEGARVAAISQDLLEQIEQIWAEGAVAAGENYQAAEGMKNTTGEGGERRYSLRELEDGTRFVDVKSDAHIFDGMTVAEMNKAVKPILMEKFAGKVIGIDHPVSVNGDSVNEYLHHSKAIDSETRKVKLATAGELDNLLDAGEALPNRPDGEDGHVHPDAIDLVITKLFLRSVANSSRILSILRILNAGNCSRISQKSKTSPKTSSAHTEKIRSLTSCVMFP